MKYTVLHTVEGEVLNKLLLIAQSHIKLALEYGQANKSIERRKAIKAEIEALRAERDEAIQFLAGSGEHDK